jgi:hypothetical protein
MQRISVNCCPYEKYVKEYGFPENVEIEHHPWDGKPFSEYYILTRGNKSVQVAFGVGGKYPQYVNEAIEEALS